MSQFLNSPADWREHGTRLQEDLENFEEFAWPVFRKNGFGRDAALIAHFLVRLANDIATEGGDDLFTGT